MYAVKYEGTIARVLISVVIGGALIFHEQWETFRTAWTNTAFYVILLLSSLTALMLIYYIRRCTLWLDVSFPWLDISVHWMKSFFPRLALQIFFGIIIPAVLDILIFITFHVLVPGHTDWFLFINNDFPVVLLLLVIWNSVYMILYYAAHAVRYLRENNGLKSIADLHAAISNRSYPEKLSLLADGGIEVEVDVCEILYCFKLEQRVVVVTGNSQYHRWTSIKSIAEKLDPKFFFPANKSLCVRYEMINGYERNGKGIVLSVKPDYLHSITPNSKHLFEVGRGRRNEFVAGFNRANDPNRYIGNREWDN